MIWDKQGTHDLEENISPVSFFIGKERLYI
jgi:hypothetical protein